MPDAQTTGVADALQKLAYFRGLSPDQIERLTGCCAIRRHAADEMIFQEGDAAMVFYIVLSGQVKIYKLSREGKEFILHLFGTGEIFAEVPIFSGIPVYPASAVCLKDCELLAIHGEEFRALVHESPDVGLHMLSVFARRLHQFSHIIEDLSLRNVESRLARYLLSVSENSPDKALIRVQKKTLSAILGTIPETLSRTFRKLSDDGLIRVDGNAIRLLDRDTLGQLADIEVS